MNSLADLKRRLFPKGIKRTLQFQKSHLFDRTTEKSLTRCLSRLGMGKDAVICIHSMLSGLGYLVGGPATVIGAVLRAAPDSTLMMPTFPFVNTTVEYLAEDPVYDRRNTPSKSGLLSETLRLWPGAVRSCHPTHPCVAMGPKADFLIRGSEKSETPFGDDSTYGRFSELDEALLLLIHTNNTSLVHRVQEMVDMPNLFFEEKSTARGLNARGETTEYSLKIHVPVLPLYLVMQGTLRHEREYVWFPDYVLLFPEYNRQRILAKIKNESIKQMLIERHNFFLDNDIYRVVRHGGAEIATVRVKPWLERICNDIRENISTFREDYACSRMQSARERGLLTKFL